MSLACGRSACPRLEGLGEWDQGWAAYGGEAGAHVQYTARWNMGCSCRRARKHRAITVHMRTMLANCGRWATDRMVVAQSRLAWDCSEQVSWMQGGGGGGQGVVLEHKDAFVRVHFNIAAVAHRLPQMR